MSTAAEVKTANRSHTSLLAEVEKRTLIWIAERLPAGVNSDHLTGLGFVSLARVRNRLRPRYGFISITFQATVRHTRELYKEETR